MRHEDLQTHDDLSQIEDARVWAEKARAAAAVAEAAAVEAVVERDAVSIKALLRLY